MSRPLEFQSESESKLQWFQFGLQGLLTVVLLCATLFGVFRWSTFLAAVWALVIVLWTIILFALRLPSERNGLQTLLVLMAVIPLFLISFFLAFWLTEAFGNRLP